VTDFAVLGFIAPAPGSSSYVGVQVPNGLNTLAFDTVIEVDYRTEGNAADLVN